MNENIPETKTVLIVDDEEFIRRSFADYFEDAGWHVFQAESGELALETLKNQSPDCGIIDIRMGGINGDEFIRKAYEVTNEMVFLICTGSPEYSVPEDLKSLPRVSEKLFKKPVADIQNLEDELSRMMTDTKQS